MRNIRTNVSSFDEVRRALAAVKSQLAWSVTEVKTAAYTAQVGELVLVAPGAGNTVPITMPPVSSDNGGMMIAVKKADSTNGIVRLTPASGNSIDGNTGNTHIGDGIVALRGGMILASDASTQWRRIADTGGATPLIP